MSDVVIRAEGLGKKYVIGHQAERERYTALRDVLARQARAFGRSAMDVVRGRPNIAGDDVEEFWALKDVDFEIRRGEVVGIIGRNGAGKSTLLKILSRITEPSAGRVTIEGRVASLLEVGTGFHPELTGRENIFLNGAILGMSRAEIRQKFDEIVTFAEIEKFLDTPVKRYSSGMYVRLAFAVAAHLEPEILLVDEVLAVGDEEFRKKCLGKMGDVAEDGRTVLFVSHNMAAVQRLCEHCFLLTDGTLHADGPTSEVIGRYQSALGINSRKFDPSTLLQKNKLAQIIDIEAFLTTKDSNAAPVTWEDCTFRIHYAARAYITDASIVFYLYDANGQLLQLCSTRPDSDLEFSIREGRHYVDLEFPSLMLAEGTYMLGAGLAFPRKYWIDNQPIIKSIYVIGRDVLNSGLTPRQERYPIVFPHRWRISPSTERLRGESVVD